MSQESDGVFPIPYGIQEFKMAFYAVILLYILFLIITGWMQFSNQDILFPTLVAIPTVVLLVSHIVFLRFPSFEDRLMPERGDVDDEGMSIVAETQAEEEEERRSTGEVQRLALLTIGWTTALPILSYYLGFAYGLPIFVFAFIWYYRGSVRTAAVVTVGFAIAAYIFFIRILGMIPWEGTLGLPNILNMIPF
jgi:hypothetical protein